MASSIFARTRMFAIWAAVFALLPPNPGYTAQDIYSVAGVPVDVTAETAIVAREQAVAQGQREGLKRLMQQLTTPEYFSLLPDVNGVEIAPLVKSFGVENEQIAADRYIAEVAASYHGDRVKALLQGRGVPIVLSASPPLLVVPSRLVDGRLMPFDDSDPWRQAWDRGASRNTVMDVVLPLGDLLDTSHLPVGASGTALAAGLAALAERYDTQAAVLVVAEGEATAGSTVQIAQMSTHNWDLGFDRFALAGDNEALWPLAVAGTLKRIESRWKPQHLVQFDRIEELQLAAPLVNLTSWTQINRALSEMPEVQAFELTRFSQTQADLRIRFVGGLSQLRRSFQSRGLGLVEETTGQWRLQQAASPLDG